MTHKLSDINYYLSTVLIGDSNVGKSSIMTKYCDNIFNLSNTSSKGIDFRYKTINIDDEKIKLQLWDTPGQEQYHTITMRYYANADIIIIVFDLTNKTSFLNINKWLNEIKHNALPNVKIFLIGNKCDKSKREVSFEEASSYAQQLNIIYIETSAKTDNNITDAFNIIGKYIIKIKHIDTQIPVLQEY
jgi:small GTP-binding protein